MYSLHPSWGHTVAEVNWLCLPHHLEMSTKCEMLTHAQDLIIIIHYQYPTILSSMCYSTILSNFTTLVMLPIKVKW